MTETTPQPEKTNAPQYTVAQARLAFIAVEFTDEQASRIFLDTAVSSEEEIDLLLGTLRTHRPAIYEKFNTMVRLMKVCPPTP